MMHTMICFSRPTEVVICFVCHLVHIIIFQNLPKFLIDLLLLILNWIEVWQDLCGLHIYILSLIVSVLHCWRLIYSDWELLRLDVVEVLRLLGR